ncbi:cadherin-like beta sandwich domain-containing protein [Glaciihabitans arcticus]|uniref:Cadherin-like beta sandwich domain-containing protein n=1 Tax=Glaciihabitans arcticus TaxID=2668039 RepID=A0A4Q9GTB7_9MICO|nr:cadherin-like beta sandwich domain-containing protein [Glaciihabitans arcticus]TBN57961.1 cadherin-like beta sandwich domain-containing protein [Glaciihabitans arcticus]
MRALSLRGALALVVASTLALASVGLTAVSASAATVAGTVSARSDLADGTNISPYFTDDNLALSASNIPGVTYRAFFTSSGTTPATGSQAYDLTSSSGVMLTNLDQTSSLIFESVGDVPFQLTSFRMQDAALLGSTYTAAAYRNGVPTGAAVQFYAAPTGNPFTFTLPSGFSYVDEVRVSSSGGDGFEGKLWQEGFNDFVVADSPQQADLSGLALSAGAITPGFSPALTAYGVSVSNSTTSTTVTPTATTPGATVTVNGVSVASGAASGAIALAVGANTITTIVTALDGVTTKTYTTTVTRAAPPSSNANLSALALSAGTLSPAFAAATTSYTATVPFTRTSLTVTPTRADSTASITVNGVSVTSGSASGAIALAVGSNTITTVVTAQDGTTTKTYTTTVTRSAASSNNQLSALSLSSGTLSPAFASGSTSYTASVGNATTSLTVTPTVADATSSVTVNGVATTSGNASGAIALAIGSNVITSTVTAQNGTPQSYTVTVTRAGSSNAGLSALSLSSGTLAPAFASATTVYTAAVSNATTSLTVTPTVSDSAASVTVNGVAVSSGNASGAIALAVGSNTITTAVLAQDGTTSKSYTVTVTRAASSNNDLTALSISAGSLSPVFAPGTTSYVASVASAVASITVTPTVSVGTASVTVNGVAVTSGTQSGAIALSTGSNTLTTVVTAQNGATKTYTITVTRAISTDNDLASLVLSEGTLSPAFSAAQQNYATTVPFGATSLTVTPTLADAAATVQVNGVTVTSGSPSDSINLNVGANLIVTSVTAQDGSPRSYTVTVTRLASSNNFLSALGVSAGTLSPAFSSAQQTYSASVPNATATYTLTPVRADPTATITVNGQTVLPGGPSGPIALAVGTTTITTIVTAQDGTTRTYTLSVERPESSTSTLSALAVSNGSLDPVFAPATTAYALETAASSITITPTVTDATATVEVNGVPVASGAASPAITLPLGETTITTTVTAQDDTTTVYTIDVFRTGAPVVELTHDLVVGDPAEASTVTFTGSDLIPGSTWKVTLHSAPVVLASGTIGLDGLLNVTVTLPAGIDPGAHRVALVITPPAGAAITSTIWFTVLGNGAIGAISLVGPVFPGLVITGIDGSALLLALLVALLAMAAGVLLIVRGRRRTPVTA